MATSDIWFVPVCDVVLHRIELLYKLYETGYVVATKPFINLDGRLVDKPTIYGHKIRFTAFEMSHLVRLLKIVIPNSVATENMIRVEKGLKNGVLKPPNYYEIDLRFYPQEVEEMYKALLAAKSGSYKNTSMDDLLGKQTEKEKGPFEF